MGQKAAELLIHQIQQKETPLRYQTIVMHTELIIRESSIKRIINSNLTPLHG
jgi:LacI family transcriptional regulator